MNILIIAVLAFAAFLTTKLVLQELMSRPVGGRPAPPHLGPSLYSDLVELDPCGLREGGEPSLYESVALELERALERTGDAVTTDNAYSLLRQTLNAAGCPDPSPLEMRRLARKLVSRARAG